MVKEMVKRMLDSPHAEELQLRRLNYGVVTLIPKTKDAATIKQYRPICLDYVCYKIVTKVLTNRLERVADKVVSKSQTAFMKNGNILDGVVTIHEVFHELRRTKQEGVILKLDFEKAYDRVNWDFLQEVLLKKGFL